MPSTVEQSFLLDLPVLLASSCTIVDQEYKAQIRYRLILKKLAVPLSEVL